MSKYKNELHIYILKSDSIISENFGNKVGLLIEMNVFLLNSTTKYNYI